MISCVDFLNFLFKIGDFMIIGKINTWSVESTAPPAPTTTAPSRFYVIPVASVDT